MRVVIRETPDEVARYAADRMAEELRARRAEGRPAVLGIATGSSPLGAYRELANYVRAGEVDITGVAAFALDEYVGIDPAHPESYHSVIQKYVTEQIGFDPDLVHVPNGSADDLDAACVAFEQAIRDAGGIDLQFLGIGSNGHIAFNEPQSSFSSRTRVEALQPGTREDNARFFNSIDEVPVYGLTQGIGTILDARALLLVAQGEGKAEAVANMIEGPLAEACPASALRLHADATVVIDRAAASRLERTDYFDAAEAQRR